MSLARQMGPLIRMPQSVTAGLLLHQSSLRMTSKQLAISFPAFLSNRMDSSAAAEQNLSFLPLKQGKETMLCLLNEQKRAAQPPHRFHTWLGSGITSMEAGSKESASGLSFLCGSKQIMTPGEVPTLMTPQIASL